MRPTFIILFSESLKLTLWGGSAKDWEHYTGIQWNCAKQQLSQINKFRFLKNLLPITAPSNRSNTVFWKSRGWGGGWQPQQSLSPTTSFGNKVTLSHPPLTTKRFPKWKTKKYRLQKNYPIHKTCLVLIYVSQIEK